MDSTATLPPLLRLLDDENQDVQKGISQALLEFEGDASDDLAALGIQLNNKDARLLSKSLHPGRQQTLKDNWLLPLKRLNHPDGDFETFESLLRLLSDFLHDGITLRPSLSDQLDLLANELESKAFTPLELAHHLFRKPRFKPNKKHPFDPRNSDLAWSLSNNISNPLGLGIIYILTAHRLNIQVHGLNFPGHFLTLIESPDGPTILDPSNRGQTVLVSKLLKDHPELSKSAVKSIQNPCSLAHMLLRMLANMNIAFTKADRPDDTNLIQDLIRMFQP